MEQAAQVLGISLATAHRFWAKSALQDWLRVWSRKNHSLLADFGAVRDYPNLEEILKEIYQRRGRPETEEG
jgi:hypothetical protein